MIASEIIEELDKVYVDTLVGINTHDELIKAKAHQEVVGFIKNLLEPRPKKRINNG